MIAALTRYLGVTPKTLRIFLTISLSACIYWFLDDARMVAHFG